MRLTGYVVVAISKLGVKKMESINKRHRCFIGGNRGRGRPWRFGDERRWHFGGENRGGGRHWRFVGGNWGSGRCWPFDSRNILNLNLALWFTSFLRNASMPKEICMFVNCMDCGEKYKN
jgi:hypothetical protein